MADKLLLSAPRSFSKLVYTRQLWKAWEWVRNFYSLWGNTAIRTAIPGHWGLEDLLRYMQGFYDLPEEDI